MVKCSLGPIHALKESLIHNAGRLYSYVEFNILNQTTSAKIITSLKSQFARHSIPYAVRSLNCRQFSSSDFDSCARELEFTHTTPYPTFRTMQWKS